MKTEVIVSLSEKELRKIPKEILESLAFWVQLVEQNGISEVRKIGGYNDELLRYDRKGQRSIRLNRSWRAYYTITENGEIQLIDVIEINKHKY